MVSIKVKFLAKGSYFAHVSTIKLYPYKYDIKGTITLKPPPKIALSCTVPGRKLRKLVPGLFPAILGEKAPGQNWDKMINLPLKFGEINDIEHKKGSKIYPPNQVNLDLDGWLRMGLLPPLRNFADISYLVEN